MIKLLSISVIHTRTLSVKNYIFLPINQLLSIAFEVKKKPEAVCVLAQVREGLLADHVLCDKMRSKTY